MADEPATPSAPPLPDRRIVTVAGFGVVPLRVVGDPAASPAGGVSRPPVVLLHGYTATADLNWFAAFGPLGASGAVVALDLPGHGDAPPVGRVTLDACADLVAAACNEIGVTSAIVVGWSMGGAVAQLLWERRRSLVAGLVLCATAPEFTIGRSPLDPLRLAAHLPLGAAPAFVRRALARRAWGGRDVDDPIQVWAFTELLRSDPQLVAQAGVALGAYEGRARAAAIDVPTAVIVTTGDDVVPTAEQRALAALVPAARVIEVPGGHGAFIEATEDFVPALVRAVDDVAGRLGSR